MQLFAEWFAWRPYRCGLIALVLSLFVFLPFYKNWARICIGLAALIWWFFTYTEATTPRGFNVRLDLIFISRAAIFTGIGAMIAIALGWKRQLTAKPWY